MRKVDDACTGAVTNSCMKSCKVKMGRKEKNFLPAYVACMQWPTYSKNPSLMSILYRD